MINPANDPGHAHIAKALRERVFDWMRCEGDPLANCWSDLPPAGSLMPMP